MDFILNIFAIPISYLFKGLSYIFGHNFAALMFWLTLIVNLILMPLTIKTQRSTAKQQMLRPKLDALKKKYGDNMTQQDKMKYQQEMQELYQKENVSMSGGCLPLLIRLPFLLAVYRVVQSPLEYIFNLSAEKIQALAKAVDVKATGYYQMSVFSKLTETTKGVTPELWAQISEWDFTFFGIQLKDTPHFSFNFAEITASDLKLWIIPLLAFGAQMLTSVISLQLQKKMNPDQPNMTGMMLSMPLISLFFAFSLPAAVGLYWAFSSLVAGLLQAAVQVIYSPQRLLAEEQAKLIIKRNNEEKQRTRNA